MMAALATPLVLLHGLGSACHEWAALRERLGDVRVIAPDAPGHGGRADGEDLGFEDHALEVIAAVDELGWDRAFLVGNSMGAATAMTIACIRPELVAGLLLVAPAWLDEPAPANLERLRKLGALARRRGLEAAWDVVSLTPPVSLRPAEERHEHRRWFLASDPVAMPAALETMPRRLPRIDVGAFVASGRPSIVVTWQGDPIHPAALAERVSGVVSGSVIVMERPTSSAGEADLFADLLTGMRASITAGGPSAVSS